MPEFVGSTTESKKAKTEANLTPDTPTKAPSTDPPVAPVASFATITPNGCNSDKPPAFVGCAEGIDGKKEELGDVPQELFAKADNLGYAMKKEAMEIAALSRGPRQDLVLHDSSDDEEFDIGSNSGTNILTIPGSSPRIGNRNEVYAFQYACPYVVTAHMGKNGPFTDEKIYDKEFMTHLFESIQKRSEKGIEGFNDKSLLCNKLDVHSVRIMRNRHENRARVFRYSNGGSGYYWVFVRVFTKKQVSEGINSEATLLKWLDRIRAEFCATKARFDFRLGVGGVLGKSEARIRALDTLLLDRDVAEYARMIYGRKIDDGTLLKSPKKVAQFYSVWNESVAKALLS